MEDKEFQQFKKETKDTIIKLKGQIDDQDKKIKELNLKLINQGNPIKKNLPEEFDFLKVYKLYGGTSVYTTTTNLRGFPGQAFLVKAENNTPRRMVAFQIGNTVSQVSLNPINVYSTTTGLIGINGEMFLVNATGNTTPRRVVAFKVGSTVSSVALT